MPKQLIVNNTPFDRIMLAIIIIALIFYLIHAMGSVNPYKKTCDTLKKPHKWTYEGEEGSEYMVCSECRMLPGGGRSEDSN